MFYSHSLLSRKGPLGVIWIAAYCFKKLKRGQIASTDISSTVDKIMPEIQISHRVFAQLLLGIVKIFSKKVDFLYDECNEALNQMRKTFIPTQRIAHYGASDGPRKRFRGSKEVTSVIDHIAMTTKEHTTEQQIETMCASYHKVTVTLPERFELDSFDLGVLDDGDNGRSHQLSTKDELKDDRSSKPSYLIECFSNEVVGLPEYNSACFTPLTDILPSSMMDVDLEHRDVHNTSNFASVQKSLEEFHQGGDFEKRVCLSGSVPLHVEIPDCHKPLNHDQTVPSVGDKILPVEEQRNLTERINLQGEKTSESGKGNSYSEKHSDALPSDKQKTIISGTASPKFMLPTPAIRESSRVSRKRKKNYNESIILPNKVMRQTIHDASDLVCKRRKLPHTNLDTWKFWRFSSPCQIFTDPLIPFSSSEPEKLPQKKLPKLSKKSADVLVDPTNIEDGKRRKSSGAKTETKGLMQKLDGMPQYVPMESAVGHIDPTNMEVRIPDAHTEKETEVLMQNVDIACPTSPNYSDIRVNSSETVRKEFTSPDASDYLLEIMEFGSRGDYIDEQDNGWSPSTRAVAQYLCDRFLKLKEQKQEATLSLAQILEGKARATCAKFFYETLTLKTYGCIDVRQDFPYGDVSVLATPAIESFHKVPM